MMELAEGQTVMGRALGRPTDRPTDRHGPAYGIIGASSEDLLCVKSFGREFNSSLVFNFEQLAASHGLTSGRRRRLMSLAQHRLPNRPTDRPTVDDGRHSETYQLSYQFSTLLITFRFQSKRHQSKRHIVYMHT